MNTRLKILMLFCLGSLCGSIWAQENTLGTLPSLNLNKTLKNDWRLNLSIQARNGITEKQIECGRTSTYEYMHTDYTLIAAKKTGLNNALAGGILLRYQDQELIIRFIQQFTLVRKYNAFRMAHRFRMDQTKSQIDPLKYRLRYRATLELPLNGTVVDPKEWYLKINHEYLNAFQAQTHDLEVRLVPLVGYKFSEKNKLETGFDYRRSAFINNAANNDFWLSLNWYLIL